MSYEVLPHKHTRRGPPRPPREDASAQHDSHVSTHGALCSLLKLWRDDPDKLGVACAAWTLAGYAACWLADEIQYGPDWPNDAVLSREEAGARIEAALHRRHRTRLRQRAEGVLLALDEFSQAIEADRIRSPVPSVPEREGK